MNPNKAQRTAAYQEALHFLRHTHKQQATESQAPNAQQKQTWLKEAQRLAPMVKLSEDWLEQQLLQLSRRTPPTRDAEAWRELFPRYPLDQEGFGVSFGPEEADAYRAALAHYGVVVIRALSPAQCDASVAAIFEEINGLPAERRESPVDPEDPQTWEACNWPSPTKYLVRQPAFHPQAFANRTDPTIHHIFTQLWREHRLIANIDNWGITRGTTNLPFRQEDGQVRYEDRPHWDKGLTKHWDYNPWLFVKEQAQGINPGYQGIVAFEDHTLDTGCHLTLPGGARFLPQWCKEREIPAKIGYSRRSHRPKAKDPIVNWMQPIPIRKGDLIVWSWGQLHSCTLNQSAKMRLHQYIRMFPAPSVDPHYVTHDRYAAPRIWRQYQELCVPRSLDLRPCAKRLLGLESWH